MKTIVEYLLSKNNNKTLTLLDEIKRVIGEYEKEFEAVLQVIEKYYEEKNFYFILSTIMKLINEEKFVLSYKYRESVQKFDTVTGISVPLEDKRTKVIKLSKFGRPGLAIEIINIEKLTLFSIIVTKDHFEIYSVTTKDAGEIVSGYYGGGGLNWELDINIDDELSDDDIEKVNKIFEKVI